MKKVSSKVRRDKIAELLVENGSIKVGEMASMFDVTTETIRKDIIYLNSIGVAKKKHGGAFSSFEFSVQPMQNRENVNSHIKSQIAKATITYLPEGSILYLDSGSTVLSIAKALTLKGGYTVITSSISAANVLCNTNNTVHITGGQLNSDTMSLMGYGATNFLAHVKFDFAILGTSGFQQHNGPSSNSFSDAEIKRIAVSNSRKTIVVAESEKAKSSAMVEYASWKNIDYFVTDHGLSTEDLTILQQDTNVILVSEMEEEIDAKLS